MDVKSPKAEAQELKANAAATPTPAFDSEESEVDRSSKRYRRHAKAQRKKNRKARNAARQEPKSVFLNHGRPFVLLHTGQRINAVIREIDGKLVAEWPGMPAGRHFVLDKQQLPARARSEI